ncbi:protein MGARP [Sminthopsis crassicaudata]|uniref:protein MGARP n=1 Tax=Sminthopsis crassicaudata TaxID=9301 RepID=UPI003D689F18
MYLRRAVGKTLTLPLRTPPSSPPLLWKHASLRQMSSKRVPGLAGSNMIYYLFVGVTFSAGGYYAYRTVTSDQSRYIERMNTMQAKSTMKESPEMLQHPDEEPKATESNEACSEAPSDASPLEAGLAAVEETPDVEAAAPEETPPPSVGAGTEETPGESVGTGAEEPPAESVGTGAEEPPAESVGTGAEEPPAESAEAGAEEARGGSAEAGPELLSEAAEVSAESGPEVTDAAVLEAAEPSSEAPEPEKASADGTELEEEKKSPAEAETDADAELQEEAPPRA